MKQIILAAFILFGLCGCDGNWPSGVSLAFSSYSSTPVVVTEFSLNDASLGLLPQVVSGQADTNRPFEGAGRMDVSLPSNAKSKVVMKATWVEILTGRAWHGTLDFPIGNLQKVDLNRVEIMPVFGPNGLLLVTSDPTPESDKDQRTVDIAQICAIRDKASDTNYRAQPKALPQLFETLDRAYPPVQNPVCKYNGD